MGTLGKPRAEKVNTGINKADAWAQSQFDSDKAKQTPLLTNVGRESYDLGAGTGKTITGIASGDWKQAGRGAKQMGKSVLSALTMGSLRGMNDTPPRQFVGGSQDAYDARLGMYTGGIGQGQETMGQGLQIAGQSADQSMGDYQNAMGYTGAGMGIGAQGLASQNAALSQLQNQARQRTPSLAQAQLQQGLDQTQRGMMGMAAQTRGGNQAAALRNAQIAGVDMGLQTNQQAAQLRAQEEAQRQSNILGAQQYAAGAYGGQAGLGYGMGGQGLGLAQGATGQLGSLGLGAANVGLGQQNTYMGGLSDFDKAQAELDAAQQKNAAAARGGIIGAVGKGLGMMFGGG